MEVTDIDKISSLQIIAVGGSKPFESQYIINWSCPEDAGNNGELSQPHVCKSGND